MKRSLIMVAALATLETTAIATSNLFSTRHTTNDPGAAKILNIDDGAANTGGGDEIVTSGDPGALAAAAMADPSAGQQQAEAGAVAQADADAVIMAKGEVIGDDSPTTTTAVGDQADANPAQQT